MGRKVCSMFVLICFVMFALVCFLLEGEKAAATGRTNYDDLVRLFREWRMFQRPKVTDGVPDYTPAAMSEQARRLKGFQKRLAAIDISEWPVSQQTDYHLVRVEMNGLEFDHRVLRPWFRDPAFYVMVNFQFGPKMYGAMGIPRLPLSEDKIPRFRVKLKAIPKILEQAKGNLTEGAADLALLGIRSKGREKKIFQDLILKLKEHHPEMVPDAELALAAIDDFRGWLEANKDRMAARAGIGIENYNWYLKNVLLLPYNWEELMAICKREYERAIACMKFEEHRNRRLPKLEPVSKERDFQKLFNESQAILLNFLKEEEIFTVPDYMVLKPAGHYRLPKVRDYFQHILDRDPLPLQPHDFVGHSPDARRHERDDRPIRGVSRLYFIDGTRAEALATGMEEILMHVGLLDKRPRARELTYNLLTFRAARAISDLKMHSNELTLVEGFQFNIDCTPYGWLPEASPTMWHDIELYMRQPGYGVGYLIGSVQLQKLLADRAIQLGESFALKQFMDEFLAAGMIPIALARWEMTGLENEIRKLW